MGPVGSDGECVKRAKRKKTREAQKKLQLRKTANNEKSHKKAAESGVGVWGTGPPQKKTREAP